MVAPARIFVTGGSGFIGRATLAHFDDADRWQMRVLMRPGSTAENLPANAEIIRGDITQPESYRDALTGSDIILHMAARTGAASAAEHDRMGRQATADLIEEAQKAGVGKFLFVSSIAAGYTDLAFYPYGVAKREAEKVVASSGMAFCIIRPTLVLGQGSPIWDTLGMLAGLPVIPLPQRKRPAQVQPVDVADVARAIVNIISRDRFDNETLEIGGPDKLSFKEFLWMIARERYGRRPRVLPLPVRLVQLPLALIEPIARRFLPATAGQFAVFANDSVATDNSLAADLHKSSQTVTSLVHGLAETGQSKPDLPDVKTDEATLQKDAQIYANYLCRRVITAKSAAHFAAACAAHDLAHEPQTASSQRLLALSRRGYWGTWLADGFAGTFARKSLFRRRLIVLTAVLEHAPETHDLYDDPARGGPVVALARLATTGVVAGVQAVAGVLAFVLLLIFRRFGRRSSAKTS